MTAENKSSGDKADKTPASKKQLPAKDASSGQAAGAVPKKQLPGAAAQQATGGSGGSGGTSSSVDQVRRQKAQEKQPKEVSDKTDKIDKAADSAKSATNMSGGQGGKGADMAGGMAGQAADKAVSGKGNSAARRGAGRYAGVAAKGAVDGAQSGGAHGAVVGAAKDVAIEGAKDVAKGGAKAAHTVTGGSPDAKPADKRLGAGGTGYERETTEEDKDSSTGSKVAKGAAVGGAAAASPPAMAVVMLMAFFAWLKSMFFQAMAMLMNLGQLIWQFIVATVKAIGHFIAAPFLAIGSGISSVIGAVTGVTVTSTAASVGSGVVAVVASVAVGGSFLGGVLDTRAITDGGLNRAGGMCVVNASAGGSDTPVSKNTEKNAQAVFSVLSGMGMPKENIAGILGNWSQESGVDPTSVEGIYDEPYQIGPKKQAAWDGNFTQIPGQSHGGIGLGQWSNGRTVQLLDYADAKGGDWYSIKTQLAFMVDKDSGASVVKDMIKNSQGSPGEAAVYFHNKWERSADGASGISHRKSEAEMWYGKMSGWEVDDSILGGVKDIVGGVIDGISDGVNSIFAGCDTGDSSTIGLTDGGMSMDDAKALAEQYNDGDADKVLNEAFNGGGPGQCNGSYVENCVSFSWYFMVKYTSYDKGYQAGNGKDVASAIAHSLGKKTTDTPAPYSIFSHSNSSAAGHTGVVLGVDGDRILIGEAAYCAWPGRARWVDASEWKDGGWEFVDVSDLVTGGDISVDT